jgi:hypothetical protein
LRVFGPIALPVQSIVSGGDSVLKRRVASVLAVAAIGVVGLVGGASAQPAGSLGGGAQISKSCGYGSPHETPGGVKCLGPGEYCSHKPGYAKAYKRAGFRCDAEGRLVER